MDIRILKPITGGEVTSPESKSHAVRLAFASALSGKAPDMVKGTSLDVQAGLRCADAVRQIMNGGAVDEVSCSESALTFRMLLPVVGALGAPLRIRTEGSLRTRTSKVFTDTLEEGGMNIGQSDEGLWTVSGKLAPGDYRIPGNVSSQFVTGLLFALPLLEGDSRIVIDGPLESEPYIRMTLDVLRKSGIEITEENTGYLVKGSGIYSIPEGLVPEGDWSAAAFWLFAGACLDKGRSVTVKGLNTASLQGDRAVLDILERMGARITAEEGNVTVAGGDLMAVERDMSQTPDLVPAMVPAAVKAKGMTVMRGISRLRLKESDRPGVISEVLAGLGGRASANGDSMVISHQSLKGGTVSSFGDHRIAMMAACLRTATEGNITVKSGETVAKSYPDFWYDYGTLGGKLEFIK